MLARKQRLKLSVWQVGELFHRKQVRQSHLGATGQVRLLLSQAPPDTCV
jgi:hypothetical protein